MNGVDVSGKEEWQGRQIPKSVYEVEIPKGFNSIEFFSVFQLRNLFAKIHSLFAWVNEGDMIAERLYNRPVY